jgi:hypothetical protein
MNDPLKVFSAISLMRTRNGKHISPECPIECSRNSPTPYASSVSLRGSARPGRTEQDNETHPHQMRLFVPDH